MSVRVLVILQIACAEFLAAAFREGPRKVFSEPLVQPAIALAVILVYPVWLGLPILVYRAVGRSDLPAWKCWIIAVIQVGLAFVIYLALLPAVS